MNTDFKETQYFKYLIENSDNIENDRFAFNKKISELLSNSGDEMGVVLKCHLIIEHYIDAFLTVAYPTIVSFERIRITFNQKIELINNNRTTLGHSFKAVKSLNSLRNKFAHKLGYVIQDLDLLEMENYMSPWNDALGNTTLHGIKLIENFTIWFCMSLDILTNGIKKETPELGLVGYLEWLNKMNSIKE